MSIIHNVRYSPDQKRKTHQRIVKNAARRFRAEGVNGAGVAEVMKASGLTVGGFYKHFGSKDHLLVEAMEQGLREIRERLLAGAKKAPPGQGWKEIVRIYLSPEHCEHLDAGCPIAALAPDIARAAPSVKKQIERLIGKHRNEIMNFIPGPTPAAREKKFILAFTAMSGAVSLARTMTDPVSRRRVLDTVRDHLLRPL